MNTESFLHQFYTVWNFRLFVLNDQPVTVASLILFVGVLIVFSFLSALVTRVFLERLLIRFKVDEGTRFNLRRLLHYLLMLVGVVIAFQFIGIDLSGLAVIFGLLSVGIGFGLQNVTSNFVAGLIILFERPIRVGDRVSVGGVEGDVLDINMRSTTIRTMDNISIIVPNSEFVSSPVTNWSHRDPKVRLNLDVGVSYQSDPDQVMEALLQAAKADPRVLSTPKPDVIHRGFGDSAWDMRLRVWIQNPKEHPMVRHNLNIAIIKAFREQGIEIPFPQRDLHFRNALPSSPAT